LKKLTS